MVKKEVSQRSAGQRSHWFAYFLETPRWVLAFLVLLLVGFWLAAQGISFLATAWRTEPDRAGPP